MANHTITVNGEELSLEGVDPHVSLLWFLRDRGLTGTKEGCAEGECGACAVVVVRPNGAGARYEPVNSCLVLAAAAAGLEVWTAEGFARDGTLHPVQQAMIDTGGSQCGYCTPGFVVSLFADYYREGRDGYDPESIGGNLCRCTGYRPIRDAARSLGAPAGDDPFLTRLKRAAPAVETVEHHAGGRRFHRPTNLTELFAVLAAEPKAKLVAGGTDVVVEVNQLDRRFDAIVSVDSIDELQRVTWHDDRLEIGAGVSLTRVEHEIEGKLPVLEELFPLFSSRLIRNRATLGGNLVNASPIGDSPPALLALDASVRLASKGGERDVPLSDFFVDYRKTVLQPGEIVASVSIPRPFPALSRFYKVSKRVMDDISTVAAAFALDRAEDGTITKARLAYGGVAATPKRAEDAEAVLVGKKWSMDAVRAAQKVLVTTFSPMTDHRGSADYRNAMVTRLLSKFYAETSMPIGPGRVTP